MKYAHINENMQILGWYDKEIHTLIPTANIEVSDEAWQSAINSNHNKVNADGTTEAYDFRTDDEKAQQAKEQSRQEALATIAQLEASQLRSIRELMLDANNEYAKAKLADIEAKIQAERAKL